MHVLLLFVLFSIVPELPARSAVITSISYSGNSRTRESVLRRAVSAAPGDPFTAETAEQIRADVLSLGLFSSVDVEPRPSSDGVRVDVIVEERWTLIPVPFFRSSSSGTAGGLFVIEGNLLGFNKQLIAGGVYGSEGFTGLLVYNDPAVLGSRWVLRSSASVGRDQTETADPGYDERWELEEEAVRGGLSVGYRITDSLTLLNGVEYESIDVTDTDRPLVVEEGRQEFVVYSAEAELSVRDEADDAFFSPGYRLSLSAERSLSGESWGVEARTSRDWKLLGAHRLGLAGRCGYGEQVFLRAPRLGGRTTQRVLTSNTISEDRYATGGLAYEMPVLSPRWGTFTVVGFYEGGYLDGFDRWFHGGGGGLRLYLSRIRFPALGFDYAWNVPEGYGVFSFSFGGRF